MPTKGPLKSNLVGTGIEEGILDPVEESMSQV